MSADAAVRGTDLASLMTELAGQPSGRAGSQRWRCIVPSHEDANPSTTVFTDARDKERWKCWSCGCGGTAIDALVEARSMSVADAISTLEERTGTADERTTPTPAAAVEPRQPVEIPLSPQAADYAAACAELLWEPAGADARAWLHSRGLNNDVLRDNQVGFDPGPYWLERASGLPGHMSKRQSETTDPNESSGVTFVSFNAQGEPLHVQSRLLNPRAYKYVNPRREHGSIPAVSFPRTPVATGPVLVTEGVADGLIAVTAGFRASTVTAATTVRQATADQLVEHSNGDRIVLAFDNDDAGTAASTQLKLLLGNRASVLKLPTGNDLTDTYRQRKDPAWQTEMTSQTALAR